MVGIRTRDHYIKSVMLYQLSYGIFLVVLKPVALVLKSECKINSFFLIASFIFKIN